MGYYILLMIVLNLCFRYVTDQVFKNNITICEAGAREKHVFTSNGHIVDIQIVTPSTITEKRFFLKYEGKTLDLESVSLYLDTNTNNTYIILIMHMNISVHRCIVIRGSLVM